MRTRLHIPAPFLVSIDCPPFPRLNVFVDGYNSFHYYLYYVQARDNVNSSELLEWELGSCA